MIKNPILRGFCPDPCILRVENDYFIAVSTFEWWPGVRIYHSRNLAEWEQIPSPLVRESQLNMMGDPVNGGVWAPCLSYFDGTFYLAYSDLKCQKRPCHAVRNFAIKTNDIFGDWSDGVYVNGTGFDPSIFHDPITKKSYWLNMRIGFRGVILQEFDRDTLSLVGKPRNIFKGAGFGSTEGPHIYYRDGWYYLVAAEGGTGYGHCVVVARSRDIWGEYTACPHNPIITARERLKKAGHASFVETLDGDWFIAYLCSRPFGGKSVLGRETAIQPLNWTDDGWPCVKSGAPLDEFEYHNLDSAVKPDERYAFLRVNPRDDAKIDEDGNVTLIGREGILSNFRVSLAAKRVRELPLCVETTLDFTPQIPEHTAGITLMYNNENFFMLEKTVNEELSPILKLWKARNRQSESIGEYPIEGGKIKLRVKMSTDLVATFEYAKEDNWKSTASFDASWLCDEDAPGFTGLHTGLYCSDQSAEGVKAAFTKI